MTVHCNTAEEDDDSGAGLATMGKISFVDLVRPVNGKLTGQAAMEHI